MNVTVCIGSSCHLKGAAGVLEELQYLIRENGLENRVRVSAAFCMGSCTAGVNVTVDGEVHSVERHEVKSFFEREILAKLAA